MDRNEKKGDVSSCSVSECSGCDAAPNADGISRESVVETLSSPLYPSTINGSGQENNSGSFIDTCSLPSSTSSSYNNSFGETVNIRERNLLLQRSRNVAGEVFLP